MIERNEGICVTVKEKSKIFGKTAKYASLMLAATFVLSLALILWEAPHTMAYSSAPTDHTLVTEKESSFTQLDMLNVASTANKSAEKPHPLEGQRLVALTFDDGPNPYITTAILDFLAEHDVPATFYVLGNLTNRHPKIVRRMADEGHQVGNHSQTHRELPRLSAENRQWEINTASGIIGKAIGHEPTTIRPPYGSYNAATREDFNGIPNILWSVDPQDWRNHCADYITQHILSRTQDGCIVLLHDVYWHTYHATRRIVPALLEQGFVFVTVDELLEVRGAAQPSETIRHRRPQPQQ